MPRLMASNTANRRSSSHSSILARTSSSVSTIIFSWFRLSSPISQPRTAFISACSKLVPMAITSPVAFICVPSVRLAYTNLSNGHFGNFTTT